MAQVGYAVAVGGGAGVARATRLLSRGSSRDMAMLGVTALDQIGAEEHLMAQARPSH